MPIQHLMTISSGSRDVTRGRIDNEEARSFVAYCRCERTSIKNTTDAVVALQIPGYGLCSWKMTRAIKASSMCDIMDGRCFNIII